MTGETEAIPILVTLGLPGNGTLDIRFPPQYEQEIRALLDEWDIRHGRVLEFSAGGELWIEAVRVLSVPGGLAALAAMLKAFMHRHDGKRFVLNGEEIETAGLSRNEIEQLLQAVAKKQAQQDVAWQ